MFKIILKSVDLIMEKVVFIDNSVKEKLLLRVKTAIMQKTCIKY